jgi:hypothetical protein
VALNITLLPPSQAKQPSFSQLPFRPFSSLEKDNDKAHLLPHTANTHVCVTDSSWRGCVDVTAREYTVTHTYRAGDINRIRRLEVNIRNNIFLLMTPFGLVGVPVFQKAILRLNAWYKHAS